MLIDVNPSNGLHKVQTGLYLLTSFEGHYETFRDGWYEFDHEYPEMQGDTNSRLKFLQEQCKNNTFFSTYGSCDSIKQFLKHQYGKTIIASSHQFCVVFHEMWKKDYGDRRWHKHGPHIGRQKPQYEHFKDEPNINHIFGFQVYRKQ